MRSMVLGVPGTRSLGTMGVGRATISRSRSGFSSTKRLVPVTSSKSTMPAEYTSVRTSSW